MKAFLLSDDDSIKGRIRQVLLRAGLECPVGNVIELDMAAVYLSHEKPELVVLVLPPDPERSLAVLAEVRGKTKMQVVVVGPAHDAKLVLRSLRAGADEYVDSDELECELEAALARWRTEGADQQEHRGRVIAVLSPSGGSGSSTLASN